MDPSIQTAARFIEEADALLVTAGAGMGVDSGLPDFRGNEGFWKAYPPMRELGLGLVQMANPRWFSQDPPFAWGFYGHRLALYRSTKPHRGFEILRRIGASKGGGAFVFTSNVDGAFQRAGFDPDRVVECHGAIDFMQCTRASCSAGIYAADGYDPIVEPTSFRAAPPLPKCPSCGSLARPNILMFGDFDWDGSRTAAQDRRLEAFFAEVAESKTKLVVVECGAGTAIPTVRNIGEQLMYTLGAKLVRINVREHDVPPGAVGIAGGALQSLEAIESVMGGA